MATLPAARYPVLQALFWLLACSMLAILTYTISIHGLHFPTNLFTLWKPSSGYSSTCCCVQCWSKLTLWSLDWIGFKEETLITFMIWVVLLVCFRSITAYACRVLQFSKLMAVEAWPNLIDYFMLRNSNRNATRQKRRCSRAVVARVAFSTFGILICGGTVIHALAIDHSSHVSKELQTAWVVAVELSTNIIIFVLVKPLEIHGWENNKEMPSRVGSNIWIVLLMLFGSITASCYIFAHLVEIVPCLFMKYIWG